jgi:putative transposase
MIYCIGIKYLYQALVTNIAFGNQCKEMGARPSMGSVGDAYDNAMAESFFATLECKLIARRS